MSAEGLELTGPLLTFRVGPGRFAVFLEQVLGVQDRAGTGAAAGCGVTFQGEPVAMFDCRRLWWGGLGPPAPATPPAAIIVSSRRGAVAMMVDRVEGIVEGVEMLPLPALVAPFVRGAFRGVTQHAEGGRLVVDTAALAEAGAVGGQRGPGEA